jgi:hypothetical protein
VSADEGDGYDLCVTCGRPLDAEGRDAWLGVEVYRPRSETTLELAFCRQDHAQQWFAQPLPPEPDVCELVSQRQSASWHAWWDRLLGALVVAGLIWALLLMALGSYELVHLLGGWD